ncbi:hypothetical protein DPMN_057764 [Dreissena polymorpha]|uniref:Uncharacterized protein n=1 Tax=Dreissena polymorpha TaxID=45954 RepID=A0A9D4C0S1_DREPO|nr:hypothetical protein DPMN_057764 [Dreissena polymorpha]
MGQTRDSIEQISLLLTAPRMCPDHLVSTPIGHGEWQGLFPFRDGGACLKPQPP